MFGERRVTEGLDFVGTLSFGICRPRQGSHLIRIYRIKQKGNGSQVPGFPMKSGFKVGTKTEWTTPKRAEAGCLR